MNIVFVTDDNGVPFTAASLLSVSCSSAKTEKIKFHIITPGLSSVNLNNLSKLELQIGHEIRIVVSNIDVSGFQSSERLPKTTFLRFFMADLLPDLGKAIYLDYDVLVRKPIRALYDVDVEDFGAAVALDRLWVYEAPMFKYYEDLGLVDPPLYFNSGVMVVNLVYWRRNEVATRCAAWAKQRPDTMFMDQDAINFVLQGKVRFFSSRWNATTSVVRGFTYSGQLASRFRHEVRNAAIVHFTGHRKPWMRQFRTIYGREFVQYIRQLPWDREVIPKLTATQIWERVKDEKFHYWGLIRSSINQILGIGVVYAPLAGEQKEFDG